jgi:putative transposase
MMTLTHDPNHQHNNYMARQARIVIPNTAHHITQRGNRGDFIFFEKEDYKTYLDILNEQCLKLGVSLYSYCLIPNQVHFIAEPSEAQNLSRAIGETHRRYTNIINKRQGWTGHLFQNRFFSYACDEQYMIRAARYIETLPVTLKLTPHPQNYLWSSAKSRIRINQNNNIIKPFSGFQTINNWEDFLMRPMNESEINMIQLHLQTGRPRGSNMFLDTIERQIGRSVRPKKRGRKPKNKDQDKAA